MLEYALNCFASIAPQAIVFHIDQLLRDLLVAMARLDSFGPELNFV